MQKFLANILLWSWIWSANVANYDHSEKELQGISTASTCQIAGASVLTGCKCKDGKCRISMRESRGFLRIFARLGPISAFQKHR